MSPQMDPQVMALVQAMGGMQGMAQNPDPAQAQSDPGLWAKLMALFSGKPIPGADAPPGYQPIDTLPPDAQMLQKRKEEMLRQAMGAE